MSPLSCEEVQARVSDALDGIEMEDGLEQAVADHLEGCPACARAARELSSVHRLFLETRAQDLTDAATAPAERASRAHPRRHPRRFWGSKQTDRMPALIAAGALVGIAVVLALSRGSSRIPTGGETAPSKASQEAARREHAERELRAQEELVRIEEERRQALGRLRRAGEERRKLEEARQDTARQARAEEELRRALERIEADANRAEAELARAREEHPGTVKEAGGAGPQTPPPARAPETRAQRPVMAAVARVQEEVYRVSEGARARVREGDPILPGDGLESVGAGSRAIVRYLDGTVLELGGDTKILGLSAPWAAPADDPSRGRIEVESGSLVADVVPQRPGRSVTLGTPLADLAVLGTRFTLKCSSAATRLEVREGRVKITRKRDKASIDVAKDHWAAVAQGIPFTARPLPKALLAEDFEDPRAVQTRWLAFQGSFPVSVTSKFEIDLTHRPPVPPAGEWGKPSWIQTREVFRLPLRISVDVEAVPRGEGRLAGIVIIPAQGRDEPDGFFVAHWPRNGGKFQLTDGQDFRLLASGDAPSEGPARERWTIELEGEEVRVFLGEKEILRGKHGKRGVEAVRIRLDANAASAAPDRARVAFDNLRVEPLQPRER